MRGVPGAARAGAASTAPVGGAPVDMYRMPGAGVSGWCIGCCPLGGMPVEPGAVCTRAWRGRPCAGYGPDRRGIGRGGGMRRVFDVGGGLAGRAGVG